MGVTVVGASEDTPAVHPGEATESYRVIEQIEDLDFRLALDDHGAVMLRTTLAYDLHVRPAAFLFARLNESDLLSQLSLRRVGQPEWTDFQPLSLVSQALHRGEEIEIRVLPPVSKAMLLKLMAVFRECPLYRDYTARSERAQAMTELVMADPDEFVGEFESEDKGFSLIKLNIENFIIGHVTEIEGYLMRHIGAHKLTWDGLHEGLRRLLCGEFETFGILSLDVPLDNLMQTRDMCYHLHFQQIERRRKIPYAVFGVEWGREYGLSWRRKQTARHRFFYERESEFYRDLYLVLVLRERGRLERFVAQWRDRLEYSLQLRRNLRREIARFESEMGSFSPNFDVPSDFRSHIHLMGEMAIKDLSRLTSYFELLLAGRISLSNVPEMPAFTPTEAKPVD